MKRIIVLAAAAVLATPALAQDFGAALPNGLEVKTSASQGWTFGTACYVYDDGSTENSLGLIVGGDMAWMQHFDPQGGCETITNIQAAIGWSGGDDSVLIGEDLDVFVWDDVNNDGDPTDAVLLGQGTAVLTSANDDVLHVVQLDSPVTVTSRFFIGANIVNPLPTHPAPMDTSQMSNGRAWVSGVNEGPASSFDPNDVNAGTGVAEMDAIGFSSVFLLRAEADGGECEEPCDMNCDGTVDASDIEFFIDILFNGATPCASCTGDTNGDGSIDAGDIEGFINCLFP